MTEYGSCPAFGYQCEYVSQVEAQAAEIEKLRSIVRGWHYLAVGPDEGACDSGTCVAAHWEDHDVEQYKKDIKAVKRILAYVDGPL